MRSDLQAALPALVAVALALTPVARAQTLDERITAAAQQTWLHGITEEIAQQEVGTEGVPVLLRLLADTSFPRRDNVVALLGHLGGAPSSAALIAFLGNPPASLDRPEEDRALLLAPQSLGQIAGRGDVRALEALLEMTEDRSNGGVLAATAARGINPNSLRDDLLHMALRGLAYSRDPRARARLQAIANDQLQPWAAAH